MRQTTLTEYQIAAKETAIYPNQFPDFITPGQIYVVLGQGGETGEIQEKLKKAIRENDESYIEDMRNEIGDTLWYLSQICEEFNWSLGKIADDNIDKLHDRDERGVLEGEGDER